jgi:hypothetical protein
VTKDIAKYLKETVLPFLRQRLQIPAGWKVDIGENWVYWYPDEWNRDDEDCVSLNLSMPSPADAIPDSDPSVNLFVSKEWLGRTLLFDNFDKTLAWHRKLEEAGFGHIADHEDWDDDFPFGKVLPWLKDGSSFDEADLKDRIATELATLIAVVPEITESIRELSVRDAAMKQQGKKK